MPKVLELVSLGHPVLRRKAEHIVDSGAPHVRELIEDLIETMLDLDAGAVGLAAPQVGRAERLFVMHSRPSPRYPDAPVIAPCGIINPELMSVSQSTILGWETCYSMLGYGGMVPRAVSINVRWTDAGGATIERELAGLPARVFLHELDHLDGIMFFERLNSIRDLVSVKERERVLLAT